LRLFVVGWNRAADCAEVFESWDQWEAGKPIELAAVVRGGLFRMRRAADAIDGGHRGGGAVEVFADGYRVDDGVLTFH